MAWCCIALAVALPGVAEAERIATLPYVPDSGPVLSDDWVAWVEEHPRHGFSVFAAGVDRTRRQVFAYPDAAGYYAATELSGGPGRLVAFLDRERMTIDPAGGPREFWTFGGSVSEGLEPLTEPLFTQLGYVTRPIDAGSTGVAYPAPTGEGRVIVADGVESVLPVFPVQADAPRVAGRWNAWMQSAKDGGRERPMVVVRDRTTGLDRVAQVLPVGSYGALTGLELAEDGTVVATTWEGNATTVWIARPDARALTVLSGSGIEYRSARAASGTVALYRAPAASDGRIANGTLALLDLRDGRRRIVAHDVEDQRRSPRYDIDDDQVAWMQRDCDSVEIHVASLAGASRAARSPRPGSCPLRLSQRPAMERDGISFGVSCRGFTVDCTLVDARVDGWLGGRWRTLARGFAGTRYPTVDLTRAGRAFQHRCRTVRVRVTVDQGDPHPGTPRSLTPQERRAGRSVLSC